ncbi:MAG: hypothetical protein Q9165_002429 [Trypethelium subeluteriae]
MHIHMLTLIAVAPDGTGAMETASSSGNERTPSTNPSTNDADSSHPIVPKNFIRQPDSWFKAGRYFTVFAYNENRMEQAIHEKTFILLDTRNNEGTGVLVRSLEGEDLEQLEHDSSKCRTHMKLYGSVEKAKQGMNAAVEKSKVTKVHANMKSAYLDEYTEKEVPDETYIFLEHPYNIAFKYKYEDHGILSTEALDDLRFHILRCSAHSWGLEKRLKEYFSEQA